MYYIITKFVLYLHCNNSKTRKTSNRDNTFTTMKETVNVNIGSVAFILDEDAYRVLGSYFDDIRRRLPEGDAETMGDIEARVAEIFRERVASPMRVITLDVVRATMAQMSGPSPPREGPEPNPPNSRPCANSTARAPSVRSPASAGVSPRTSTPTRR